MFRCVSITSLVVPAISETIATSLLDRWFSKLDLPALVGPRIAILKPSLILSPTFWSFKIFSMLIKTSSEFFLISFKILFGKSSSGKSILAQHEIKFLKVFLLNN